MQDRWVHGNKGLRLHVRTDVAVVCAGRGWCRNACSERTARLLASDISKSCCIYHARMSLPHVWSPGFSQHLLFFLISQKRQSRLLGSTRYTGSKSLERSLRIMPSHFTFQIQRLRRQALAVGRHVVSGMVWMSLRSARCQDGAASVIITDTTTRSVR